MSTMFLGLAAGLALLASSPIAMAASDPGRPADSGAGGDASVLIIPDKSDLETAEPSAPAAASGGGTGLDLTSALGTLENELRPELELRFRYDADEAGVAEAGGSPTPLGAVGPWTPHVGGGDPLDEDTLDLSLPYEYRLPESREAPVYQGFAGVDYAVSPLTSLSFRYRAIVPEDDPELRPTDSDYFTHNLEFGLHLDF